MSKNSQRRRKTETTSEQPRIGAPDILIIAKYLDILLDSHHSVSRKFRIRSYSLMSFGASVTALSFIPQFGLGAIPDWMKFGPTLLTLALSAYQYSTMLSSARDLVSYQFYREELGKCIDTGDEPTEWLVERLKKI